MNTLRTLCDVIGAAKDADLRYDEVGADRVHLPELKVLIPMDFDDTTVWADAVRLGCTRVVFMPEGSDWLLERIDQARLGAL